ncbi:MAG: 23S rRNA (adenine(1618)-N(6))-methyltransferase RlmF [Bacteroidetes bacterium]|nr:23S rRNA (adenine(1618)-N(6))-methyltransferase RlmF [Bacteroidota bacterium]
MSNLHPNNFHKNGYNFDELTEVEPNLTSFVFVNEFQTKTINFFDAAAVKALNKALLKKYYQITYWDIPENYLCPPIPGRAEYIHHIADLIKEKQVPQNIKVVDIGVGANCIYPILGASVYGWNFIGTDISKQSLRNAEKIIQSNKFLTNKVELRLQDYNDLVFSGVIGAKEIWDVTICNPPFHSSEKEADLQALRKLKNLYGEKDPQKELNFKGRSHELWCDGGELKFVVNMIHESADYGKQCFWFTSLISQQDNLPILQKELKEIGAKQTCIIPLNHGNKQSRILAWSFLTTQQQKEWKLARWI